MDDEKKELLLTLARCSILKKEMKIYERMVIFFLITMMIVIFITQFNTFLIIFFLTLIITILIIDIFEFHNFVRLRFRNDILLKKRSDLIEQKEKDGNIYVYISESVFFNDKQEKEEFQMEFPKEFNELKRNFSKGKSITL